MINDEQIAKEMKYEKLCASGNCSSMPQKQKMQIRVIHLYLKLEKYPILRFFLVSAQGMTLNVLAQSFSIQWIAKLPFIHTN